MSTTNDIVAIFSSAMDASGNFIEYHVVSGSTFSEEYSETLDSGHLVIAHVPIEKRLFQNNKMLPYEFVKVYDKSGNTDFEKYFIVDSFNEDQTFLDPHHPLFTYTIDLMSETKILEKVQCPNLSISHKVAEDGSVVKNTILHYIQVYMDMYVPKIKFSSSGAAWDYKPLIEMPPLVQEYKENKTLSFTGNEFSPSAVEGEKEISLTFQLSDIVDSVTVQIISITVEGNIHFTYKTATYDGATNSITFSGRSDNALDTSAQKGSVIVRYYYKNLSSKNPFYNRFNVDCADMTLTAPTLRQVLTCLMEQVGCIPTVKHRTLGFLDFQVDPEPFGGTLNDFGVRDTVTKVNRSWSSDSRANHLVSMSSRVLDTSNTVVSEILGFRDRNNVFLKQQENLKLETSFPIFKVEQVKMKALMQGIFRNDDPDGQGGRIMIEFHQSGPHADGDGNDWLLFMLYYPTSETIVDLGGSLGIHATFYMVRSGFGISVPGLKFNVTVKGKIFIYSNDLANNLDDNKGAFSTAEYDINQTWDYSLPGYSSGATHSVDIDLSSNPEVAAIISTGYDLSVCFSGTVTVNSITSDWTTDTFEVYDHSNVFPCMLLTRLGDNNKKIFLMSADITPLIVENSKRSMLDANFVEMQNARTLRGYWAGGTYHKGLSDYIYGTFGYSIGSKEISGFSSIYSLGEATMYGWYTQNYTYIENVFMFLQRYNETNFISDAFETYYANILNRTLEYLESLGCPEGDIEAGINSAIDVSQLKFYNPFNLGDLANINNFDWNNDARSTFSNHKQAIHDELLNFYKRCINFSEIDNSELYPNGGTDTSEGLISFFDTSVSADKLVTQFADSLFSSNVNFSFLFFDVKYQPINSANLSYVKDEDTVFALEQLDESGDAFSDFDRFSVSEQEKVERIGNETLSIAQKTTNVVDLQPVPAYYLDDFNRDGVTEKVKYIVYRKQWSIDNYAFMANYTASKDAILKDYFTSIRTKYRAYQYIDYNASILRKEKDIVYVQLTENGYFDGDDHIFMGDFPSSGSDPLVENKAARAKFISGCSNNASSEYIPVVAACEISNNQAGYKEIVKNEVSVIANSNTMAFVYEDIDNVGSGPILSAGQIARGLWYGGVLQTYQIWDEDSFNPAHIVFFTDNLNYDELFSGIVTGSLGTNDYWDPLITIGSVILRNPIVGGDALGSYNYIVEPTDGGNVFAIVDDKTDRNLKRTFNKDTAERISHTVQFIYYTDSDKLVWTEEFIRRNGFMLDINKNKDILKIIYTDKLEVSKDPFTSTDIDVSTVHDFNDFVVVSDFTNASDHPKMVIDWTVVSDQSVQYVKVVAYNSTTDTYKDVICFKRGVENVYVNLNDTRSRYVLSEKNGILYKKGEVMMNIDGRYLKGAKVIVVSEVSVPHSFEVQVQLGDRWYSIPEGSLNGHRLAVGEVLRYRFDDTNYELTVNGTVVHDYETYTVTESTTILFMSCVGIR